MRDQPILSVLYKAMGFRASKIPPQLQKDYQQYPVPVDYQGGTRTLDLRIVPSRGKKHRIFCKCPVCSRYVPLGRLKQHENTNICKLKK